MKKFWLTGGQLEILAVKHGKINGVGLVTLWSRGRAGGSERARSPGSWSFSAQILEVHLIDHCSSSLDDFDSSVTTCSIKYPEGPKLLLTVSSSVPQMSDTVLVSLPKEANAKNATVHGLTAPHRAPAPMLWRRLWVVSPRSQV